MRKRIAVLLLALLLTGCSTQKQKAGFTFYYPRTEYQYTSEWGAIGSEYRKLTGNPDNISYLLSLYLMGPGDEALNLPFPAGTHLISVQHSDGVWEVELSEFAMSDSRFTLSCSCLALVCRELDDTLVSVTVRSGSQSLTVFPDALLWADQEYNQLSGT